MQIKAVDGEIVLELGKAGRIQLTIPEAVRLTCKCQCGRVGASQDLQNAITEAKNHNREARYREIEKLEARIKELKEIDK